MPAKDLTIEAKFRRIFSSGGDGKWTEVKYIPIKINDEIVLTLLLTRTKHADGTISDELTLTPEQGAELAEKLSQAGQSTLHIVLPDAGLGRSPNQPGGGHLTGQPPHPSPLAGPDGGSSHLPDQAPD